MLSRRKFSKLLTLSFPGILVSGCSLSPQASMETNSVVTAAIGVERRLEARLGMKILDTGTGQTWSYHADQRFPMCSTFKVIASAAFLAKVDRGEDSLSRKVVIEQSNLVSYSPMTETRIGEAGMSMSEICEAALTLSDNTAGNTILESIGGPSGVTQFAREIGDEIFRLDRWETELNEAAVGDPRDTTSPAAMTETLQKLLYGNTLSQASKSQLQSWLVDNKTGDAKLRAGLPTAWTVGDKTGGGNNGTMADVAFVLMPNRKPLIVSIYMTETTASFDDRNAGIADIARALERALG